jgi:hypothetical protein
MANAKQRSNFDPAQLCTGSYVKHRRTVFRVEAVARKVESVELVEYTK